MIRSRHFQLSGTARVYFLKHAEYIEVSTEPIPGMDPADWVILGEGFWSMFLDFGGVNVMFHGVSDPCPLGHTWNYKEDKCTTCGLSFDDYRAAKPWGQPSVKCECGSDVAGFTSHAYYCPKHVGDK
jgi:hypothetical protein